MPRIYDISLKLSTDLTFEECSESKYDIDVMSWTSEFNPYVGKIQWYHQWKDPNDFLWLLAGHYDDKYFLRFNSVDFLVSFHVSQIYYRTLDNHTKIRTVRHILFNQVIPMVLNHRGIEVLHASSVLISNEAVVFVGNGGYGKSTLAASLMKQDYPLISDDAVPLLLEDNKVGTASGPPEINLWIRAIQLLNIDSQNDFSNRKQLVTLSKEHHCAGKFPIKCIYFLRPSSETQEIKLIPISEQEVLIELIRAAHRLDITDKKMLQRQFNTLRQVAKLIPSKTLYYPASIPEPLELSSVVLSDIKTPIYAI